MLDKKTGFLILCLALVYAVSLGQATRSPFSVQGVGDIFDPTQANHQGSAGLGVSNPSIWHLNSLNPALLRYNALTVFGAGVLLENRTVSADNLSETNLGSNANYFATAFPIKATRWTSAVGLTPYSRVNYRYDFEDRIDGNGATVLVSERGSGGFNRFYWANGFAITRNLSLGVTVSYLFSAIEKDFANSVEDLSQSFDIAVQERVSASDFAFNGGISYRIDSVFGGVSMNIGAVYDFRTDLRAKKLQTLERRLQTGQVISIDTITDESGNVVLPAAFRGGISFNKRNIWAFGAEVKFQKWSAYENFEGNNEDLQDLLTFTLGGEITPDPTSVSSYLKRITYRFGASYENTQFSVSGNQVRDYGINFGWSLPISRISSLDMAFRFGRRGDINETILEENYYKIYFGVTFNDRWFVRRKFD